MSGILTKQHVIGRRTIYFSVHAVERYYERSSSRSADELRAALAEARWSRALPRWVVLSTWHRARAEGAIVLNDEEAFIVNRNSNGDLVAVTFLSRRDALAGAT